MTIEDSLTHPIAIKQKPTISSSSPSSSNSPASSSHDSRKPSLSHFKRRKSSLIHSNNIYNKCFQNYYNSYQYLQSQPTYVANIKPNVYHWQLRDLIKFNQQTNDLYYTKNDSIMKYNLNNYQVDSHLKLNYNPRCFNHYENYIVTGGVLTSSSKLFSLNLSNLSTTTSRINKGLYTFYNGSEISTLKIGEMINNDVTLYKHSNNQFNSFVCNNDTNLYCVDIANNDIKLTNKINCETNTCLNNVVKNPHKNLLTVTGDSSSIFFVDPKVGEVIHKIDSHHESGFGVSYHSNGHLFSTVFQDGICQLYDLRNLSSVVTEIKSTRHGHQSGAFRVCKFSPDMNDLLIISEHVGRVHLIDLRDLSNVDNHQVIVVPAALDKYGESKTEDKNHPVEIYGDFTSPLVYDYDYLTNVNPKLFKEFNYELEQSDSFMNSNYVEDSYQQYSNHIHGEMELSGIEFVNPVQSNDSKIIIGCQDGGVLLWDINTKSRRSFSSFEMI